MTGRRGTSLGRGARGALPIVLLAAVWGGDPSRAAADIPNREAPRGEVVLPSGHLLRVEIADTGEKRARGYMFRERIPEGEGMVFLMEALGFHPFWMKNCRVGLDILWLDEGWKVVHIERRVPPCRDEPCPSYSPMQASLYVLEVGEGVSEKEGIRLGDRVVFRPPAAAP